MLYPCSCPIQQDGGIARRATLIKQLRNKYPELLLLDCGGFTAGGLMDEYTQNISLDMQRSEVNYKALEIMRYDAVGVGPDEFNFGKDFFLKHVKASNPVYLSADLDADEVIPYLIKDIKGVKIAIIGITGSSANQKSEGLKINPSNRIGELINRLKQVLGVKIVILLSNQGEGEDLKLIARIKGIDVIFVGSKPLKGEAFAKVDSTFFVRPPWQARKLGKLTLNIKEGRLFDCKIDELAVSENYEDAPEITAILPRCYSDLNCKQAGLSGTCQNPGAKNSDCLFVKPNKIDLLVIDPKDCVACNTESFIELLKKKFPGLSVKKLEYPSLAAQNMIKDLSLQALPAYIFSRSIEQEDNFQAAKSGLRLVGDFYVVKPQTSGLSYFLNQKVKKGNLDLFFSLFDKDAALLLTNLREFNPRLHFLTVEKDGGFDAQNGIAETEECSRAVCLQKYYPDTFWDYLICRSSNIRSSYWEDCLSGNQDAAKIKSCARGKEGGDLLRENTSLNKELQISSGPSYLLNNQEIFSSRTVPSKEELRKILKKVE